MSYANGPKIVTDGLACYLDAANRKSYPGTGDTVYDLSGNGRNGTRAGTYKPSWNSDGYFTFTNGTNGNNYTRIDTSNPATTDLTVEVVYRTTTNGGTVLRQYDDDFHIRIGRVSAGNAYNDYMLTPSTYISLNTWVYNAITWYNGITLKFYRNAINVVSGNRSSQDTDGIVASTVRIGTRNDAYSEHFDGDIALYRFYTKALSPDEILQNYNALKGRYGL